MPPAMAWQHKQRTKLATCFSMLALVSVATWLPSFCGFATAYTATSWCALLAPISITCCGLAGAPSSCGVKDTSSDAPAPSSAPLSSALLGAPLLLLTFLPSAP